jgi:hypothetical protein
MTEKDFHRRLELIERGIRDLDAIADAGLRAAAHQVVQAVLELHGHGLERLLEIIDAAEADGALIDALGRDPLVGHLLILHSLHPQSLEARVQAALDAVRPTLLAAGAAVDRVRVVDGGVRLRLLGGGEHKAAVERAIMEQAPDVVSLEVEGVGDAVVGFVPLQSLRDAEPRAQAAPIAAAP